MRSPSTSTRRVWLLVNVLVTLALLPALFTGSDGSSVAVAAAGTLDTVPVSARVVAAPPTSTTTSTAPAAPTTTSTSTTTTAPPRRTTSTTAAPTPAPKPKAAAVAAPAPTPKPAPTTTTTAAPKPAPKPTTTTTAPPAPATSGSRTESGKASWYDHKPGICAHKTLPMGTVVTVSAKGRSTTCTVGDRGPFIEGWIIDLHPQQFEQLAPRSTGVIAVTITW